MNIKMGCASSDRKDPSQYHREKMLIEYLNGLQKKTVKEVSNSSDKNSWHGLIEQYEEGDLIYAPDGSSVKIIEKTSNGNILVECLNCNLKFQHFKMNDHLKSTVHIENLF
jgi:hypothetical protein